MILNIIRQYGDLRSLMMPKRITVIYGARRVGKTTLINNFIEKQDFFKHILQANGDNMADRSILASQEKKILLDWVSGYDLVFIDEAQRIEGVGWSLKLLIDTRPDLAIIVTGSSGLDLSNKLGEPLTGRQAPYQLFPISISELSGIMNDFEIKKKLDDILIYGMYPEVLTTQSSSQKQFILNELVDAYLLKDVLELQRIKKPKILLDLLTLIALQIGSEVSLNELSRKLGIDLKTVERYLELLEKCFVLYNLHGFSGNLRNEVTRKSKYYFYDTGIRNALLHNFNPIALRNDSGAIWENFMVIERLKFRSYTGLYAHDYFWRTWEKQEIDLLEEYDGFLHAFEFKMSPKKNTKAPKVFTEAYPTASFEVANADNFLNYTKIPRHCE